MTNSVTKRKAHKIWAVADVSKHNTEKDMWMSHNGYVYDVTQFAQDHPGGDDILHPYMGKDVTEAMKDGEEHVHSKSAYEMMDEFLVGRLVNGEKTVSDDWVATDDFHPDDTDVLADFERSQFLDLSKPLLWQIWTGNFSKEYYLEQVHQPRHVTYSARMFSYPVLEALTLTPWYVPPIFWLPIASTIFYLSTLQFTPTFASVTFRTLVSHIVTSRSFPVPESAAVAKSAGLWALGCFAWTILEYGFHRFLFHVDHLLPDANWALLIHFTAHGIHHYLPMDQLRLVMPPTLFFLLQAPVTALVHKIMPAAIANGLIAGAFNFYVLYDCMHYAMHHSKLPSYLQKMKKYHLAHHYQNFELGFGVTSKMWDWVFNTQLQIVSK